MVCGIIVSVLFAAAALPERVAQSDAWERMAATLVAGDMLIVELDGRPRVNGRFVSADIDDIIVWMDASEHSVRRDQVARVIKLSRPHRHGVLVGALLGAAIAGAFLATSEDLNAAGRALWVAIGGAGGAAVGLRADRYRRSEVVYVR